MTEPLDDMLARASAGYVAKLREKKPRVAKAAKPEAKRADPEWQIQRSIRTYLHHTLENGQAAASIATAQGTSSDPDARARYGAKLKAMGVWAGEPDMRVYLEGGVTVHLEVKAARGTLSEKQMVAHAKLTEWGHPVYVVRSIEEARQALVRHGARFRDGLRRATPV